jgi:protein-S-isoprenylcysteine O-methyltransferase Ste14
VNTRRLRLRAVWLLVVPFFWLAAPAVALLGLGAVVAAVGLLIRGWAAGTIHKERELTTTGPYAYTRNPLYVGSFLLGIGISMAGGHWIWPVLFMVFYVGVYGKTMAGEVALLTELFGDRYQHYAANVPAVVPRLRPYRAPGAQGGGFTFAQYRRNREWEALLGAAAGFAFLAAKWWWMTSR